MIKAVFLDFYGTLAKWTPDAEHIQQAACAAEGLRVDRTVLARAYPVANTFLDAENARWPVAERGATERDLVFAEYERRLLSAAGVDVPQGVAKRVWDRVHATPKGLALYDDALPALEGLHAAGLKLGVISNMGPELGSIIGRLGLGHLVEVWMSSAEAGVNKPHAAIFERALTKAGTPAREVLYVGDSYDSDVVGARNAGIHPLLLLRPPLNGAPEGVPVVTSLGEVQPYLEREC